MQKHGSSVKKHDSEAFPARNPSPERIQGDAHANKQHWSSHGVFALLLVTLSQLQEDVMNSVCLWRELWALRDKTKDILHVWHLGYRMYVVTLP